jgi:ribosomal protein S7
MPQDFDKCVMQVMKQGKDKNTAFAMCTSAFKKAGKKTRENIGDVKMDENIKEKKFDEEGREIVAENVKFYINASVDVIEG